MAETISPVGDDASYLWFGDSLPMVATVRYCFSGSPPENSGAV